MNRSILALSIAAAFVLGTLTLGTSVFADNTLEFDGIFKGAVRSGNEQSGQFVDTGTYTMFEGVSVAKGNYKITPDDTKPCGGTVALSYTIKDRNGNSMSFEDQEINCYVHQNGKNLVSVSQWTVVDGEGKFEGATGSGYSRVVLELRGLTYHGGMTGEISLGS